MSDATATAQTNEDGTTVLVCQCRSTSFHEKKRTKRAVVFQCTKCGTVTSVQGHAAIAKLQSGIEEVRLAATQSVITPLGDTKQAAQPKEENTERKYTSAHNKDRVMWRSSIPRDAFEDPFLKALEIMRILHGNEERFRRQDWAGYALELICADFIAGVDPRALIIWDAMNDEVQRRMEIARNERGRDLTKRTQSRIRRNTCDRMAEELGLFKPDEVEEEPSVPKTRHDEEDGLFFDDGQLRKSVVATLQEYAKEFEELYSERLATGVADDLEKLFETWDRNGGYMLRIEGDPRTKDANGKRPTVYAWLISESDRLNLDFGIAYEDAFEDIPNLCMEVTELLPQGYSAFNAEDQWDIPACATEREEIEA